MQQLNEITERLASAIMAADSTDLPALAQVHEELLQLGKAVSDGTEFDAARKEALLRTAADGGRIVEQIILREVSDADAALREVNSTIAQLQGILNGAPLPQGPAAPAASAANGASADEHAATPVQADTAINPDDVPMVNDFITEALGHIESAEYAILQLEENPEDTEAVNAIFRSFHTVKGVAGFLNLKQIGALAHAAENLLDLARHGSIKLAGKVVDVVLEAVDALKTLVASLTDAIKNSAPPAALSTLPALLEKLHAAAKGTPEAAAAAPSAAPAQEAQPRSQSEKAAAAASDGTVKVATDRLDSLINMVGELVISQSMVAQDLVGIAQGNHRLARNVSQLGKITRELQDLSMSMRMVPIQGVFQKMARVARDTARKALKEIEFVIVGGETELDRNVVEAISDPLVHMVRNSVDHGVETPEKRQAAGKPRAGRVEIKACHQAGNIVIEITDDGKGLDKARIVRKAIDAGIVQEGQTLTDDEIFKLIFHPGLSTAEKVTDISGRGVGMDVVRRNVEALRGRIEIASTEGKGSTFTIRLPLTLAVIDGQIVRVGQERYIIPITSIDQTIQPKPAQLSTVQERGEMCMVRGDLLPLFRLHRMFNVKPQHEDPTQGLIVIVQDASQRCCLLVDELLGQQQVVIKTLGAALGHVPGISGGAILGDGSVRLILDIPGIIAIAAGH